MLRSLVCFLALMFATVGPAKAADGDRHAFFIKQFQLESGAVLPEAKVIWKQK